MKSGLQHAVLFVFLWMASALAHGACSNASLQGNYGYTVSGVNSSSTLAAAVGLITADGKGGLTGFQTTSDDGVIAENVPTTGSYSINPNCSGTAAITPKGGSTSNYALVLDAATKQIEMVETDNGFTEDGYGLAQGKVSCSLAALKGTYGTHGGGFTSATVPYSVISLVTLNGAGKFTGTQTGSLGGKIFSSKISSTYTVNSNCTGTTSPSKGGNGHSYFVVVNGGKSALQIQTDSGLIITYSTERK